MAESTSLVSGLAGRYATALFELAEDAGQLSEVEADLASLKTALTESADLRTVVSSPIYSRDEQAAGMAAVADAMDLTGLTKNLIGLMASKRRLFTLGGVCDAFAALMADRRGEVTAEVKAAAPLTKTQLTALGKTLKDAVGKDVKLDVAVDESLIGGLVVKVGSKMIDTSIRSKLAALKNAMKEVG